MELSKSFCNNLSTSSACKEGFRLRCFLGQNNLPIFWSLHWWQPSLDPPSSFIGHHEQTFQVGYQNFYSRNAGPWLRTETRSCAIMCAFSSLSSARQHVF